MSSTTLDDIDEAIIAAFQEDGRQSNREVARGLGISEGTVRQRLAKLHDAQAIRFDVVTDPRHFGIGFVAFVRLSVTPARLDTVIDACAALPDIWYVAATTGRYNVVAVINTTSAAAAMRVISEHIRTVPGVNEVDIRTVVRTLKHDFHEISVRVS